MKVSFVRRDIYGEKYYTLADGPQQHQAILAPLQSILARCDCRDWRPGQKLCAHAIAALQTELASMADAAKDAS
jgi:hypothetical protein